MRANAVEDRAHARRRTERELRRLEALVARKRFRRRSLRALRGSLARAREHVLGTIREVIHKRALPLATRDLRIEVSALPEQAAGVSGAVHLALDEVFAPANLEIWLAAGSPDQVPQNVW